jgi:hypothetical protein
MHGLQLETPSRCNRYVLAGHLHIPKWFDSAEEVAPSGHDLQLESPSLYVLAGQWQCDTLVDPAEEV